MMNNTLVLLTMGLVGVVIVASARPQHYLDTSNQVSGEEAVSAAAAGNNALLNGLADYQLEVIAQRLADANNQLPLSFDRNLLRSPEMKRAASRFRQCYFNPVSCFKK